MSRLFRLVVFDLDGTLIDSSRDLATGVNSMLARVAPGTPAIPADTVRTFIGDGATTLVARSLAHAGVDRRAQDVLPVFLEEYGKVLLDTTRLYPGVVEALDVLQDRTLAVLTNKPGGMSRAILQGLGVSSRFARVVGGDEGGAKKPDPQGLRRLMDEAEVAPEATVMVGDSAIDVRTGRAAGALTAGVTYGFDRENVIRESPDVLLDSLSDLRPRLDEREGRDRSARG